MIVSKLLQEQKKFYLCIYPHTPYVVSLSNLCPHQFSYKHSVRCKTIYYTKLNTIRYTMSATVIKYVGRTTDFKGKSLWEIVGSLKNFGVGRVIIRSVFQRYPEPSFMKIVKVETCPDEERRRVRVWVEKTFRGRKLPALTEIYRTSYKTDYQLISKKEEASLLDAVKELNASEVILPNKVEMPPLMKKFIKQENEKKQLETMKEYTMPLSYNHSPNRVNRVAKDGEQPTIQITMGLGKPASPSLYDGVPLS